jgi:hypothetical protein
MHHLDLQILRGIDQRQHFAGVFMLVGRNGRLPGGQSGALFFNLLDQCVECLLPFGQFRLVVAGDDGDGLDASRGHELTFFEKREVEHSVVHRLTPVPAQGLSHQGQGIGDLARGFGWR